MEVILAKSAGFCFGVRRAVNEVYRCLEEEKDTPIYTFGPIIHNDEVVNDLKNKGVQVVDTLESLAALKKGIVIIRSHGVGRDTETKMRELGMRVIDMTCPFVKKDSPSCRRKVKRRLPDRHSRKSCASRGCRHCRMEHRRRISCKRCRRSTKAGIRP